MRETEKARLQEITEKLRKTADLPKVPKVVRETLLALVEELEGLVEDKEDPEEDEGEIEDFLQ